MIRGRSETYLAYIDSSLKAVMAVAILERFAFATGAHIDPISDPIQIVGNLSAPYSLVYSKKAA